MGVARCPWPLLSWPRKTPAKERAFIEMHAPMRSGPCAPTGRAGNARQTAGERKMTTVDDQRTATGQDDDEEAVLLGKLSGWLRSRYSIASPSDSEPPEGGEDHDYGELDEESFYSAVELQRSLFDAGLAGFSTPRDLGGQGVSREADRRLSAVLSSYRTPDLMPLAVGLSLVVPTLARYGTVQQQRAHIPATLRARRGVVPALLRTRLRLGPRLVADPRAAGW